MIFNKKHLFSSVVCVSTVSQLKSSGLADEVGSALGVFHSAEPESCSDASSSGFDGNS